MPLTEAQRQAGDADLARRRATRAAIMHANERVCQVNDLLDALETLADALVHAECARELYQHRWGHTSAILTRTERERDALRAELAAHRCRAGLAED